MHSLWPNYIDYPSSRAITRSFNTEFLIIGAGISGLCAAHTLAQHLPSAHITIVDKDDLTTNASNNNAGFAMRIMRVFRPYNDTDFHAFQRANTLYEYGFQFLKSLTQSVLNPLHWREVGLFHAGRSKAALQNDCHYPHYLDAAGVAHRVLERDGLACELGTDFYRRGIFLENGAALIQPAALTRALIETLPDNVTVFLNSAVSRLDAQGRADINGHRIKAEKVIITRNWQALICPLMYRFRAFGISLAGSITEPLDEEQRQLLGQQRDWGILSSHPLGVTVRLTADGRLMLRNSIAYNRGQPFNETVLKRERRKHLAALEQRFPNIPLRLDRSWSAVEGRTLNETSYYQQLNERTYICAIYNGSGITKGACLASHIAQRAMGEEGPLENLIQTHFAQPAPIPSAKALLSLGARTSLFRRRQTLGED